LPLTACLVVQKQLIAALEPPSAVFLERLVLGLVGVPMGREGARRFGRCGLNGLSLNRLGLNRLSLNGLGCLNGLCLNRLSLNGLSLDGLSLSGRGRVGRLGLARRGRDRSGGGGQRPRPPLFEHFLDAVQSGKHGDDGDHAGGSQADDQILKEITAHVLPPTPLYWGRLCRRAALRGVYIGPYLMHF
jgi:hypothetical protein